ncbi:hypothetical protein KY328_05825 [Candidatus Woesearchaeota archaeon]|nr:hypothetical protein [Candidatus Woesearchaeota archaeon]MBW3022418.1 hypothetical protein [Candidatus Woesearchaeota archaeon]
MSEKKLVLDHLTLEYNGLFDTNELYRLIDGYLSEKKYDKFEKRNIEQVTPSGKHIELELNPWKTVTDYTKLWMKITILMTNVKEVEVEKDGIKIKLNQGNVHIVFDGYVETDKENKWEGTPLFTFFRTIVDKYVIKRYVQSWENEITEDIMLLHSQIKGLLNLYRY